MNAEIIWIQEKLGRLRIYKGYCILEKILHGVPSSTGLINCFNYHWLPYFIPIYDSWDRWRGDTELASTAAVDKRKITLFSSCIVQRVTENMKTKLLPNAWTCSLTLRRSGLQSIVTKQLPKFMRV